jgi:RNA polymerase sigma-70 factor (ECF subfamily)
VEELVNKLSEKGKRDYALVRAALDHGDEQAYSKIMALYKDALYFMIRKMVRNDADAEDLTIEAFGKAFKRLAQYTPSHAFSTWLYKIATNNCIDFLRKNRAKTVSLEGEYVNENGETKGYDVRDEGLTPEERTIKNEKIKVMREVVSTLKPRYKRIIELRFFEEFSYEEISQEMDIPLGTVKAQLFRAKELLFEILKDRKERI